MSNLEDVRYGWDFMSKILGGDIGSHNAFSDYTNNVAINHSIAEQNLRIEQINAAIDELTKSINSHEKINIPVEQFKGFVAEEWHAGTFNIDAIRQESDSRAWTLHENSYGSVDIDTNFGKQYSAKYSNTAKDAENYQATLNRYTRSPKYEGQERLIASDQVEDAKAIAHRKSLKESISRPEMSQSHMDTENHLTGTVSDDKGVNSKELTAKEAKQIAKEAKKDGFDPEKHGINKEQLLDQIEIDYINQALKAGLTAATITAITQLVPELYKTIDYLIKNGEIDMNALKKSGKEVISTSGEAFLRGSIAYCVEISIEKGMLGNTMKTVDPSVVGVAVAVILGTVKDSIMVAAGNLTPREMGMNFVDSLVCSSGYLAGMKVGGMIVQSLLPELPIVGYVVGSLLGCSICAVYNIGKNKFISFCADTGFTCFGLVDQNYEIPEEILKEMGINTIPIVRTNINKTDIKTINSQDKVNRIGYETIDIKILKRGVIGVNKVGYVY